MVAKAQDGAATLSVEFNRMHKFSLFFHLKTKGNKKTKITMLLQFRNVKVEDHIKSISKNNSGYHLNCKSKVPYNSYPCVVKVVKAAPSSQPKCLIFTVLLFLSQQGSLHPQPPPPPTRAHCFSVPFSFLLSSLFFLFFVLLILLPFFFFFLFWWGEATYLSPT